GSHSTHVLAVSPPRPTAPPPALGQPPRRPDHARPFLFPQPASVLAEPVEVAGPDHALGLQPRRVGGDRIPPLPEVPELPVGVAGFVERRGIPRESRLLSQ